MSNYADFKRESLQDPVIKAEYDALADEYALIDAMITARQESGLTQKELAEKSGIPQSNISRIESGSANPSWKTLNRLAYGMGMHIKLEFVRNI